MYVVIKTEEATTQAITHTFASLDELNEWVKKQLPPQPNILTTLKTLLKPEILNTLSLSETKSDTTQTTIPDEKSQPQPIETEKTRTEKTIKNIFPGDVMWDMWKPSTEMEKPKCDNITQIIPEIDMINHIDIVHFGMRDMYKWVVDSTIHQSVHHLSESASNALKYIQSAFFDSYCKPDVMGTYKSIGKNIDVQSDSFHKFVWVLALNFPSVFFKGDAMIDSHIKTLKTYKTNTAHVNLHTLYTQWAEMDPKYVYVGLDIDKCYHLIWMLHSIKKACNETQTSNSKRVEQFIFKTLFHYYKAEMTITDDLVTLWVDFFLQIKTVPATEGNIQSSELFNMFTSFLNEVLLKDECAPSEVEAFHQKLSMYVGPKTFARALKNLNIESVRKSAGIFYTGFKPSTVNNTITAASDFEYESLVSNYVADFECLPPQQSPQIRTTCLSELLGN